jgi:phosphatidylglycerol:prolipoprotein diacylglycerol transferase
MLRRELARTHLDARLADGVMVVALVFGLIGAKAFYLVEHWQRFVADPRAVVFSHAGWTWYGGFILATAAIALFCILRGVPFLSLCDAASPALAGGYAIARIGCQLAGDGDYGVPSTLPWAMAYPRGTVPTLERVHPTPVYESLMSTAILVALMKARKRVRTDGALFSIYLIAAGLERFSVEFVRRNPRILLGLSVAQAVSLGSVTIGVVGLCWLNRRRLVHLLRPQ